MSICCTGDRLGPRMNTLLDCLAAAMEECDRPPCRIFLDTAADVPWDTCCEGSGCVGQAWVSVPSVTAINGGGTIRCTTTFEATVNVGILRCALTMNDEGEAPDGLDLTNQSLAVLQDRLIINQAIKCCFGSEVDPDNWALGNWTSLGPAGGCVGGMVTLIYRFSDPKCA